MDSLKPDVDRHQAIAVLEQELGTTIRDFAEVAGGNVARSFSFEADGRAYIVRFNREMGVNFEKEVLIARVCASAGIPIPEIIRLGRFGTLHYAVSVRASGVRHDLLSPEDATALIPALLDMLDAIHAVDVSATDGFGTFNDEGKGVFPSWHRALSIVAEEEPEGAYYGSWHTLFETTFLERDLFMRLFNRMNDLLPHCPETRSLVHGNFGFGNVLVDNGRITAVLDWVDAKYGDVLFDVAWLDFWHPTTNWAAVVRDHYHTNGVLVPSYEERLRCYYCSIGMDALRFFAKGGNKPAYDWTKERVTSALA